MYKPFRFRLKFLVLALGLLFSSSISSQAQSSRINVLNYGAKGDGIADDQAAIATAITKATSGGTVYFPGGHTYKHSGIIVASGISFQGDGPTSILMASNASGGAVELMGNNFSISNLSIEYSVSKSLASLLGETNLPMSGLWLQSANNFSVQNVAISATPGNALSIVQSNTGTVTTNKLSCPTQAAAMIKDSNNIQFNQNQIVEGMPNLLVRGYDPAVCQNLTINSNQFGKSNTALPTAWITGVNGGNIINNSFNDSSAPEAILVQGGAQVGLGSVNNVTVSGNLISAARNYAIKITATSDTNNSKSVQLQNVKVANNTITNSLGGIAVGAGIASNITSVTLDSNTITAGNLGIDWGSTNGGTITNNVIKNMNSWGLYFPFVGSGNSGKFNISGNQFSNCGLTNNYVNDSVIFFDYPYNTFQFQLISSISLENNTYTGSVNKLTNYIYSKFAKSTFTPNSGNTTTTLLPSYFHP